MILLLLPFILSTSFISDWSTSSTIYLPLQVRLFLHNFLISSFFFFSFPPREVALTFLVSSVTQSCLTLCNSMDSSTPGFPVHHKLPELAQTHIHCVGNAIQLSHPLSSPSLAFDLSQLRVFSNELALCIRWPKYWSFNFSISPSSEYLGLISISIDWLDLLAVQGTLKSRLQHHSSKASILRCSAFFTVQLSHPYMTTGKTISLTGWTFVGKVMSLLFNMLSRLVIAFLPRSKNLNFMAAVIICSDFGVQKNKVFHCFHCFPIYLPWSGGTMASDGCCDLSFLNVKF